MTQLGSGAKVQPEEYFTHSCYIIDGNISHIFVAIDDINCKSLKNQHNYAISYYNTKFPILLLSREEADVWMLEHL